MVKVRLVFAVLLLLAAGQAWSELKVENLIWLDYSSTWFQTNYAPTNAVVNKGGQFYIGRAYITLQGDIGKDPFGGSLKGRVTLDMANVQKDGGIVAATQITPLKYAYLDYKLFGWDPLVLTMGLMKIQFGNIAPWEYPLPVKDATELYTLAGTAPVSSADFGVALSGSAIPIEGLTKNLLFYDFQLINGNGYKSIFSASTTSDLSQFGFIAHAHLAPIDGTKIGFSYRTVPMTSGGSSVLTAIMTNGSQNSMAIFASAQDLKIGDMTLPVDFLFQYIYNENIINTNTFGGASALATNQNGNVMTLSLGFGLFDKLLLPYVRYDMVNENTATVTTNTPGVKAYQYSVLMLGLDYKPTGNMLFKPFIAINTTTGDIQAMIEGEFKLNFTVWQ